MKQKKRTPQPLPQQSAMQKKPQYNQKQIDQRLKKTKVTTSPQRTMKKPFAVDETGEQIISLLQQNDLNIDAIQEKTNMPLSNVLSSLKTLNQHHIVKVGRDEMVHLVK